MTTQRRHQQCWFVWIHALLLSFGNAFIPTIASHRYRVNTRSNRFASPPNGDNTPPSPMSQSQSIEERIQTSNRGEGRYGLTNNSSIPTAEESAASVGVRPPTNAPASTWKRAWKVFGAALPILHGWDSCKPPDSKLALHCLWWKALSGNDPYSPVADNSLSYDLLPRGTRVAVGKKLRRFYPRLHHANVEIRTAFLDQAVQKKVESIRKAQLPSYSNSNENGGKTVKIRLISLGAGYDTRSIKLRERCLVDEAIELDLPQVIQAKTRILESRRFRKRRPLLWNNKEILPKFHCVDLNQLDQVERVLIGILQGNNTGAEIATTTTWHTIFLFEGVMIYLEEGVPAGLLELTSRMLRKTEQKGSLIFADRLENIPGGDLDIGRKELTRNGWEITEWLPKPGLARHMGSAQLLQVPTDRS